MSPHDLPLEALRAQERDADRRTLTRWRLFAGLAMVGTLGATIVAPFTEIDHGANNAALDVAARSDYDGVGTNLLDALDLSLNHILDTSSLPLGPKAIALVSDGGEFDSVNATLGDVLELANDNSIPLFTIGVADLSAPGFEELLTTLAGDTGGEYFEAPTPQNIADAYATILERLTQNLPLEGPLWWQAKYHQLRAMMDRGDYAKADFFMKEVERTTSGSPADDPRLAEDFAALKA